MGTVKMKILKRFREPSTYAALAALLAVFGVPVGIGEAVVQIGAGLAGLAAIFLPERAREQ
jgi:hypothetical protein